MSVDLQQIKKLIEQNAGEIAALRDDVRSIKRRLVVSSVYTFVKLIIIIGSLAIGLWYLQPQLHTMAETWNAMTEMLRQLHAGGFSVSDRSGFEQLLQQYSERQQ